MADEGILQSHKLLTSPETVGELAQERVENAAAKGRAMDMDVAIEEIVADSMESMFTDQRAMDRIDALKAQNQGL